MIATCLAVEHMKTFFRRIGLASRLAKPNSTIFKDRKGLALSATTLLDNTSLTSRLAKPNSKKYKNREVIALSVTGTLSAQQNTKNLSVRNDELA